MDRITTAVVNHTPTPEVSKAPDTSQRMARKQFNAFLYKLYGCTDRNDVKPEYVFQDYYELDSGETDPNHPGDYFIEVFFNPPGGGLMIAVHTNWWGFNHQTVDVLTFNSSLRDTAIQPKGEVPRQATGTDNLDAVHVILGRLAQEMNKKVMVKE